MKFLAILPSKPNGRFEQQLAALSKKFPALPADLSAMFLDLLGPPSKPIPWGTRVVRLRGLGEEREGLKVRLPSSDMGKGSSKAFRVILLQRAPDQWQPIALYAKNEQEDIPLKELLRTITEELDVSEVRGAELGDGSAPTDPPESSGA